MFNAQNPVTSPLGNNGAEHYRDSYWLGRCVGELPLPRAIGWGPRLDLMDSQREDLSLPGGKCPFSPCPLLCALSSEQALRVDLLRGRGYGCLHAGVLSS